MRSFVDEVAAQEQPPQADAADEDLDVVSISTITCSPISVDIMCYALSQCHTHEVSHVTLFLSHTGTATGGQSGGTKTGKPNCW